MEQLILNIKNKSKLPFLKEVLKKMEFVEVEEAKRLTAKENKILRNLEKSVDFVNDYKKGKVKSKSIKQILDEL